MKTLIYESKVAGIHTADGDTLEIQPFKGGVELVIWSSEGESTLVYLTGAEADELIRMLDRLARQ